MSRVSWAERFWLASGMAASVRMLCSRSASFMSRTLGSFAMATSILRIVAAWAAARESNETRSSLVTPSTIWATTGPNSASSSPSESAVSSTESCNKAAASVMSSIPRPARTVATASGWDIKGSPERRTWPSWARSAVS